VQIVRLTVWSPSLSIAHRRADLVKGSNCKAIRQGPPLVKRFLPISTEGSNCCNNATLTSTPRGEFAWSARFCLPAKLHRLYLCRSCGGGNLRHLKAFFVSLLAIWVASCSPTVKEESQEFRIAVLIYGAHPLLELTASGVKSGIEQQAPAAKVTIHDASFQQSTVVTQVKAIAQSDPDAIVVLGTPAIIGSLSNVPNDVPLFFGAASAPSELGIYKSDNPNTWGDGSAFVQPQANLYGYVTKFDFELAADLASATVKRLKQPQASFAIGYPYNSTEKNSAAAGEAIEAALMGSEVRFIRSQAGAPSDVPRAVRQLVGQEVDLIQIGPDNTIVAGFGAVLANVPSSTPIFTTEAATVGEGATAAVGIDFLGLGQDLGRWVILHLDGSDTGPPIRIFEREKLFVNRDAAKRIYGESYYSFFQEFADSREIEIEQK
jgi:putative ABC transport system substrate-binding protein